LQRNPCSISPRIVLIWSHLYQLGVHRILRWTLSSEHYPI
jgi:hypothetical protein